MVDPGQGWIWELTKAEKGRRGREAFLALALKEVLQIPGGCGKPKHPISTVSQSQKRGCCF
ncbi:Prcd [Phodopus roborovskii]|uniref:Prcd protein n=1 Tax=Phodopus roborovskii TaxID=109678 RepID=A0AAU9YNC9_PHORO|nr:Prcd [Phodopus roborovskii]